MQTQKYDLTEGNILQKLFLVAAPIMGTQFLQMTYNLTDMFWMGRVGPAAVAAVGTAGMYMWLSVAFMMFGRMGAEIGVSQSIGRGDRKAACAYAQNAMFLAAVSGLVFAVFAISLRYTLIGFFAIQEAHVAQNAATYLAIVSTGMPAVFLNAAITGIFNGAGFSRPTFLTNGLGLVLNMILTPIMIFILDFGIVGAAWATVIAQSAVLILNLLAIRVLSIRPFPELYFFQKPDMACLRQIFRWTTPISIESAAFTLLSMVIGRFVAAFGADALAIQRVGIQLESLSWLIAGGFSSALTAFMGQNYGRGRFSRICEGSAVSMKIMIAWGLFATAIPWLFGRPMFALFLPEEPILSEGVLFLRILSVCQLFMCLEAWAAGIFRGLGKTIPPSISTITGNALRIPLSYALSLTTLGVTGLWWGIVLGACLRGVIIVTWYLLYARKLPREDVPEKEPEPEAAEKILF